MPEQEETRVRLSKREYQKLKKMSEKSGVPMADLLARGINKLEVKKVQKDKENDEDKDVYLCGACEEEIPDDADFCPYCGVELEDADEDEDETEDKD